MKKYFINNGTTQLGPFDIEELKAKKINKDTNVWHEGLAAWTAARNIEELKPLFYVIPPKYSTSTNSHQITESKNNNAYQFNYLLNPSYFGISKYIILIITLAIFTLLTLTFIFFK